MMQLTRGFFIGLFAGSVVSALIPHAIVRNKTAFNVGDCLSNGLYYEKVTGIRYSKVLREARYELSPTINGKISAPDVTLAWIVDDSYTKIAASNCK